MIEKIPNNWELILKGTNMKKYLISLLSLIFLSQVVVYSQSASTKYYLDLDRPSVGYLSHRIWQQIGKNLQKAGVPTFFGKREILDYRQNWMPSKLTRTSYAEGFLMLGPFNSAEQAMTILNRLPNLLPQKYDGERFNGVQPGPTDTPQTWQVGLFQISGFRSEGGSVQESPKVTDRPTTMDATVIRFNQGASGAGLEVKSKGVEYGFCLFGNCGAVRTVIGDVTKRGSRVRIWYTLKRKNQDGSFSLFDVTKVQLLRKR